MRHGWYAESSTQSLIPGFRRGVTNMQICQASLTQRDFCRIGGSFLASEQRWGGLGLSIRDLIDSSFALCSIPVE